MAVPPPRVNVAADVRRAKRMLAYKIYNSSPADANVDCAGTGLTFNEFLASWFVEFTIA